MMNLQQKQHNHQNQTFNETNEEEMGQKKLNSSKEDENDKQEANWSTRIKTSQFPLSNSKEIKEMKETHMT